MTVVYITTDDAKTSFKIVSSDYVNVIYNTVVYYTITHKVRFGHRGQTTYSNKHLQLNTVKTCFIQSL